MYNKSINVKKKNVQKENEIYLFETPNEDDINIKNRIN